MKRTVTIKGLIIVFCMAGMVQPALASGKPFNDFKMNYSPVKQLLADTTLPGKDEKKSGKKEENTKDNQKEEVVKVIPKARKQPIPVPVKVNVQPVKIIKPKIIKPVVKPVIKILH